MKDVIITAASVVVLQKFKPIEMIPVGFIKDNAGLVELVLGFAGSYDGILPMAKGSVMKGISHGLLISGALKVVSKYVIKA